jgi:hypothetical protein
MPLTSGTREQICTLDTIKYIQAVIKTTTTPSWVNSVPHDYGQASAGTSKADQWRTLATIYLPIALVTLWGYENGLRPASDSHFLRVLDHTMALFQAVMVMCRNTTNKERARKYLTFMKTWVSDLHEVHPHTKDHPPRPNIHAALHVYDFALLYGPVMSWWCFPFERLIGTLQGVKTNHRIGGEPLLFLKSISQLTSWLGTLEQTILQSRKRGANIHWWLARDDCPEVIRQFKYFFDKAFSQEQPSNSRDRIGEIAHIMHDGVNYSRAETHLGNSLVSYYPSKFATKPVVGSIQKITARGQHVSLTIKRQALLPSGSYDPFVRYPYLSASLYSSKSFEGNEDHIPVTSIVSHVARFMVPGTEVAVILTLSRVSQNYPFTVIFQSYQCAVMTESINPHLLILILLRRYIDNDNKNVVCCHGRCLPQPNIYWRSSPQSLPPNIDRIPPCVFTPGAMHQRSCRAP